MTKTYVADDQRLASMWADATDPTQATVGSPRKALWKCRHGHQWEASIASVAKGGGCPYCSGRRVTPERSLEALYPDVAAQWHPTLNTPTTPVAVAPKSNKKHWWQCAEKHEWEASPNSRTAGRGCPYCANQKLLTGYNDLSTRYPEVALQWHPTKNELSAHEVMPKSNKNYWWLCSEGHEWVTTPNARTRGNGCPECSGSVLKPGVNDLATVNPKLAVQWHPVLNGDLAPSSVFPASNRTVWWLCEQGHEWEAIINNRHGKGSSCPYCFGRHATETYNLRVLNPELAGEWHSTKNGALSPEGVRPGSTQRVWWQCSHGHEWEAVISSRVSGNGCPVCAGKKVLAGFNDLQTLRPDIAVQWHPTKNEDLTAQDVVTQSNYKVWWICDLGHEWEAPVAARTNGSQCPICLGQRVLAGFNDLATVNPALAAQWHPTKNTLEAQQVAHASNKLVTWQCAHGHEWEATVATRKAGAGCPVCAGQRIVVGFNDLATVNPQLAAEWHPTKNDDLDATKVTIGSEAKAWWKCTKGHEWEARIYSRGQGSGCPVCTGKQVLQGENDLASLNPDLRNEWNIGRNTDLTPFSVTAFANKKVWWQCNEGHEWQAWVYARSIGSGCPSCSSSGPSKMESDLADWVESLGVKVVLNTRSVIAPYELDVYIPEHNFAIEFNGLYWHSEAAGKGKNYHKNKVDAAQRAGITLFQVWEDDWQDKTEIVKRMISHRLGVSKEPVVFARKTVITHLPTRQAHEFLNGNHLQGKANGSLYLGLKTKADNTLVAVMVFKRMEGGVFYLERYATSHRVPGGFTKLLKQAIKELKPSRIITFADQSVSEGNLYEKNGFVVDGVLEPDYSYLVKNQRVHKFNYRLKRFRDDPELQYQEGFSESQLAILNKLHRIWDSGKIRYILTP